MSSSFEEIYDALRSDAALFEEAQAQPEQAEEVMVKEAPVQQSTPKQARRRTEGAKATTPRSNRVEMLAKPELQRAPKRASQQQEEGSVDELIGKRSRFELGPKVVEARAKLEEELKLARQRIEELVAAKQIEPQRYAPSSSRSKGFELKFHEPREVEDKLTVVMTNRDRRKTQSINELKQSGVQLDPSVKCPFEERKYLYLGPRGDLHFYMCPVCVEFYMNDRSKVTELGSGFEMVTAVLCPNCVRGNNEMNAARKELFPTSYEMLKRIEQVMIAKQQEE